MMLIPANAEQKMLEHYNSLVPEEKALKVEVLERPQNGYRILRGDKEMTVLYGGWHGGLPMDHLDIYLKGYVAAFN